MNYTRIVILNTRKKRVYEKDGVILIRHKAAVNSLLPTKYSTHTQNVKRQQREIMLESTLTCFAKIR